MLVHKAVRIDTALHQALLDTGRHGAITEALRQVVSELAAGTRTPTQPEKEGRTRIGALLDSEDLEKVSNLARDHNMSFDAFINQALKDYLREQLHDK